MLLTEAFPFGYGEPFLIAELPYLCEVFDVTIVSLDTNSPLEKKIPPDVKVIRLNITLSLFDRIRYFFSFMHDDVCRKECRLVADGKERVIKRILQSITMYSAGTKWFNELVKRPEFGEQEILYSYWYNDKIIGTALALRGNPSRPVLVTRVHGYDLYNERKPLGRQPFKPVIDSYLDHIYFVSKAGFSYYQKTFGMVDEQKYAMMSLGTINTFGMAKENESSTFNLLSCSNIIPLKRIPLIVDGIAHIESRKIHWIHIGDGEQYDAMQNYAQVNLGSKSNCTFTFLGRLTNEEVHTFYETVPIDCFLTVSESEGGSPVSIQEALSYGIPVIGTSVGGIPEMVEANGILLSENPTSQQVADAILKLAAAKDSCILSSFRSNSRKIWENKFNAENNFVTFTQSLLSLIC